MMKIQADPIAFLSVMNNRKSITSFKKQIQCNDQNYKISNSNLPEQSYGWFFSSAHFLSVSVCCFDSSWWEPRGLVRKEHTVEVADIVEMWHLHLQWKPICLTDYSKTPLKCLVDISNLMSNIKVDFPSLSKPDPESSHISKWQLSSVSCRAKYLRGLLFFQNPFSKH